MCSSLFCLCVLQSSLPASSVLSKCKSYGIESYPSHRMVPMGVCNKTEGAQCLAEQEGDFTFSPGYPSLPYCCLSNAGNKARFRENEIILSTVTDFKGSIIIMLHVGLLIFHMDWISGLLILCFKTYLGLVLALIFPESILVGVNCLV